MKNNRLVRIHAWVLGLSCLAALGGSSVARADEAQPTTRPAPQLAAYRWAAPRGPEQVTAFAGWINQPDIWGEDFEAPETWDNIQNPGWLLGPWEKWVKANPNRRLILSVPMLPGAWNRSGPASGIEAKKPVSLAAGARGEYNQYYETLARQLVLRKMANTILRIGWEFNGGWYTSRGSDDPKAWAAYFAQIVKTMRGVPGTQKLLFCWNPTVGSLQFPAVQAWPGDEFVDIVGIDVYDQSWAKETYPLPKDATEEEILTRQKRAWNNWNYNGNDGMVFWSKFAASHKKPLAICEWGLCNRKDGHGGMDDPYFVEQMYQFIMDPKNNVMFHCYFDVQAGDGHHQLSPGAKGNEVTEFPRSAAKFQELFGGRELPTTQPAQAKP